MVLAGAFGASGTEGNGGTSRSRTIAFKKADESEGSISKSSTSKSSPSKATGSAADSSTAIGSTTVSASGSREDAIVGSTLVPSELSSELSSESAFDSTASDWSSKADAVVDF